MNRAFNRPAALVLLAAVVNLALFGAFLGLRLARPSDGARLQPGADAYTADGVIVTPLVDEADSLQPGDVVVTVAGRTLESWAEALLCWRPFCVPPERPHWRAGDTVIYSVLRDGGLQEVEVVLRPYPLGANLRQDWGAVAFALASLGLTLFVLLKRPHEPAARVLFLSSSSMLGATTWSLGLQVGDFVHPAGFWLYWVTTRYVYLLVFISFLHFALIFPQPHRAVRHRHWLIPAVYAAPFLLHALAVAGAGIAATGPLDWLDHIGLDQNLTVAAYLLLGLLALISNYRDTDDTVSRQQIRLIVIAFALVVAIAIGLWQMPQIALGEMLFTSNMMAVVGLLIPAALAAAILRHRLWDIDVIVNRAVVYSSLTVIIAAMYVLIVGVLGALFQTRGNLILALLATGGVAVLFQPLRERLQQVVNRLMYGERDDPYAVLSNLGHKLQSSAAPEALLNDIVETVATALKLPYAAIRLGKDGAFVTQAEYGRPITAIHTLDIVHQSQAVGQLSVSLRSPGETLTPKDLQLLEDITRHAGAVVYAVRLMDDLQRSRERIITAREEERRRLRRDLHDGMGPTLASQTFRLDAALDLIENDPAAASDVLHALKRQTRDLVADIRRLVYDLRPPALDELGLVGALETHIATTQAHDGLRVEFAASGPGLESLPAAVEVAAYRIVTEAATNVIRHADARTCTITLAICENPACLRVTVEDDGKGLPPDVRMGVGLNSMRERAEELGGQLEVGPGAGGGTRITADLPLSYVR
jgi:two-component system NarL family sensor kinase